MKAKEVCETAARLVSQDRAMEYGDKDALHARVARLWAAYKGVAFTKHDVAIFMILLKVARAGNNGNHTDNYVDIAGYAGIAAEMGDDK